MNHLLEIAKILLVTMTYCCLATDHVVDESLGMTYPPTILRSPPRLQMYKVKTPGRPTKVRLPCQAIALPPPVYSWYKDGQAVDLAGLEAGLEPGTGSLLFEEPGHDLAGVYQCRAETALGTALSDRVLLKKAFLSVGADEEREIQVDVGKTAMLKCPDIASFPDVVVYWTWISEGRDMPLDMSDRVTQDYQGNLWFANVLPQDLSVGSYSCNVHNPTLGRIRNGKEQLLVSDSTSGDVQYEATRLVWHSETPTTAILGHEKKLKCIFSGYPTPKVSWTKADGPMLGSYIEADFGMELIIGDVTFADAGIYRCSATNKDGIPAYTHDFNLKVESLPTFKVKPADRNISEEASVKFVCEADGTPQTSVSWAINGIPLADLPDDPRRVATETTLSFANLTKPDTQVIQCNASNKHGYVFTNAYLNVLAEPPSWTDTPKTVIAVENSGANLTCRALGFPKPRITWQYKGQNITLHDSALSTARISILQKGVLNIQDVHKGDSGHYACQAENKYGKITKTIQLIVRGKTRVRTDAVRVINASTTVVLGCEVTVDPTTFGRLTTEWWTEGHPINLTSQPRFSTDQNSHSLTLEGAVVGDSGNYTCVAHNGDEWDEDTVELIVQDRPHPPQNVRLPACGATSAEVTWSWLQEYDNNDNVQEFVISYNTSWQLHEQYHMVPWSQTAARIQVSPWNNYTVYVRARNRLGLSDSSAPASCVTQPTLPFSNPTGVCVDMRAPNELAIIWESTTPVEHNGDGFYYLVRYRDIDEPNSTEQEAKVLDWQQNELIVKGVPTFHKYEISVQSANSVGKASTIHLLKYHGHSGEGEPLDCPENLTVTSLNITSAMFSWAPVDESPDRVQGHFKGYKIKYWKTADPENIRTQDVILQSPNLCPLVDTDARRRRSSCHGDGGPVTSLIWDLWPDASITAGVLVFNSRREGPLSPTIQFDTYGSEPRPFKSIDIPTSVVVCIALLTLVVIGVLVVILVWYHKYNGRHKEEEKPFTQDPDKSTEMSESKEVGSQVDNFEDSDSEINAEYDDIDPGHFTDYGSFLGVYV